jgi:hypothetical protein
VNKKKENIEYIGKKKNKKTENELEGITQGRRRSSKK